MGFCRIFGAHHSSSFVATTRFMKKTPVLHVVILIVFLLTICQSCKKTNGTSVVSATKAINFHKVVGIRSSVRKQVFDSRDSIPINEQKMSSDIRELLAQYQQSSQNLYLNDSVINSEIKTLSVSPAIIDSNKNVYVYISLSNIPSQILQFNDTLGHLGITFDSPNPKIPLYQAWVPIGQFEALSKLSTVASIRLVFPPMRSSCESPRNDNARTISSVDATHPIANGDDGQGISGSGELLGAGRHAIGSDASAGIWSNLADGNGVKVGVISDDCGSVTADQINGTTYLQNSINNGYLSVAPQILTSHDTHPNASARQHEGLELLEIVHSIAPKASLAFSSGVAGMLTMIQSIQNLANSGCHVITDDVFYYDDPFFEDGIVAKAIQDVVALHHIVYTASAGNTARKISSFIFTPEDKVIRGTHYSTQTIDNNVYPTTITIPAGYTTTIDLQWDDPYDKSTNDFNLLLVDPTDATNDKYIHTRQNFPTVSNPPMELTTITCNQKITYEIYIVAASELNDIRPVRMKLLIDMGSMSTRNVQEKNVVGHSTSENVLCCGASSATNNPLSSVEDFSPIGPAQILQPINNGNAMGLRPIFERSKPDVISVDRVQTSFNSSFSGTSAAAPHVAGLAAQLLSVLPALKTNPQAVRQFIRNGCVAHSNDVPDNRYGFGKTNTMKTIANALVATTGSPYCSGFQNNNRLVMLTTPSQTSNFEIDLSTASTTLTAINELFVVVMLEPMLSEQTHSLKIEIQPDGLSPITLYNAPVSLRTEGVSTVFALQGSDQTMAQSFGITIPIQVLNTTNLGIKGQNPKRKWKLIITTDNAQPDPNFNDIPGIALRDWGIFCR